MTGTDGAIVRISSRAVRAAGLTVLLFHLAGGAAAGQDATPPATADPSVKPTLSMGLPQTWRPELGVGYYFKGNSDTNDDHGAELRGSLYHPLGNPVAGIGLKFEGFFRVVNGAPPNGSVRLMIPIRYVGLAWGWEYDFRRGGVQGVFGVSLPVRRGGLFGQGDTLHLDWSRSNGTFRAGITFPLGSRWMGTSRPDRTRPALPERAPGQASPAPKPMPGLDATLADLRVAARWVNGYTTPFIDQWSTSGFVKGVDELKTAIGTPDTLFPGGHTFTGAIEAYHRELVRAFTLAADGDPSKGEALAARARTALLDGVILPYDRLLGQRKKHDSLLALGEESGARFSRDILDLVPAGQAAAARGVFDAVVAILEQNRRTSRGLWDDGRLVWVPLHYALRLEDHDAQSEIDALFERALGKPFSDANQVSFVVNQQFHIEVARQIRDARNYHVLWIHDFKGKNAAGDPDRVGFEFVTIYLRALTEAVRAYDERGLMPQYIIILDQYFYGGADSERWMKVLQDPLDHTVHFPRGAEAMERELGDIQRDLRDAVAHSARLQAGLQANGRGWLKNQVKVHVNITNPADPSFTGAHMLSWLVLLPDDMMRDHRKIAFYDVTEEDPASGDAVFAGMGIAEHYTGGTWEDRGILVRGPAILDVKAEARRVLLRQGFKEDEIPRGLKPLPRPADYEARVAALRDARGIHNDKALQVHSGTGYEQKWSAVARALLYDLMPAGSTIFVPDSLWNNPLWGAMLAGGALRGARVFVIAPSRKNAPGAGGLVMSRAYEVFSRLLIVEQKLRGPIEQAGGSLRVGIYNVQGSLNLIKELGEVVQSLHDPDPALRAAFPFDASLGPALERVRDELVAGGFKMAVLAPDAVKRDPKIHLKAQLLVTRQVLDSLVRRPDMVALAERYVRLRARQLESFEGSASDLSLEMDQASRKAIVDWWDSLPEADRQKAVGLLTVGSNNMDIRGQVMDGEVSVVVAGLGAMSAYFNFAYIAGATTWVDSPEQLQPLLPEANWFTRWLARYAKNAL